MISARRRPITAALAEYVDALGHYGPVTLDDAWNIVRRTHDKQGWPVLAVCLAACSEAQKSKRTVTGEPPKNPYEDKYEKPNPILTGPQINKLNEDIATCDRLAKEDRRGYFGQPLDNQKYIALGNIGRAILAKHEHATAMLERREGR